MILSMNVVIVANTVYIQMELESELELGARTAFEIKGGSTHGHI